MHLRILLDVRSSIGIGIGLYMRPFLCVPHWAYRAGLSLLVDGPGAGTQEPSLELMPGTGHG